MGEDVDVDREKKIHDAAVKNDERFSAIIDERREKRDKLAKDAFAF